MKNIVLYLLTVICAFGAGIWFDKSILFSTKEVGSEQATSKDSHNALQKLTSLKDTPLSSVSAIKIRCDANPNRITGEQWINKVSIEELNRVLASNNPSTVELIDFYVKAKNTTIEQNLVSFISHNEIDGGVDFAQSLLGDINPKVRQLSYSLLANVDIDDASVPLQLIDASYSEHDPKASRKLVEAMANTCTNSTQSIAELCVERVISIIEDSPTDVANASLTLLSRMPITARSIDIFKERLTSTNQQQQIAALDGLFNVREIGEHTLDNIQLISSDENASLPVRELAMELLTHFQTE